MDFLVKDQIQSYRVTDIRITPDLSSVRGCRTSAHMYTLQMFSGRLRRQNTWGSLNINMEHVSVLIKSTLPEDALIKVLFQRCLILKNILTD